jgi:hypothetical protein
MISKDVPEDDETAIHKPHAERINQGGAKERKNDTGTRRRIHPRKDLYSFRFPT